MISAKICFYFLFGVFGVFANVSGIFAVASNRFDFGDTLALILGLTVAILAFFVCMGLYARRRDHLESL